MSMASAPVLTANTLPASLHGAAFQQALCAALLSYLPQQRWFGGKSQVIDAVRVAEVYELPQTEAVIARVEVSSAGVVDLYQLPLMLSDDASHSIECIFTWAGRHVIDASRSAEFRAGLLGFIATGDHAGTLRAHCASAFPRALPQSSRVSSAEQSNTSIFYDDAVAVKLYRRLQAGDNPDLEVPRFLAEQTTFRHTPAYLGEVDTADGKYVLAFAQKFAPNHGDAWKWFTENLRACLHATNPDMEIAAATAAAALVGTRTAEMHRALATPTEDAAFAMEDFDSAAMKALDARLAQQKTTTLQQLRKALADLNTDTRVNAEKLLANVNTFQPAHRAEDLAITGTRGKRIRVHGDYHLGQLLRTDDDFLIVDFEGEPARTLAERRWKDTPLRDVAGMLRSFSYAAGAMRMNAGTGGEAASEDKLQRWEQACTRAFSDSYFRKMESAPDLLPTPPARSSLLTNLLFEKALYELSYELNNRPAWADIPLRALIALAAETGSTGA
jgi:maltose alpha-D-glucosyltransferase/alpha-amylase